MNAPIINKPRAVLFDLDGTLADTAPDLAAAIHLMQQNRKLPLTPLAQLRPFASAGARGMLHAGFGITPSDPQFEAMRIEFLENYADSICQLSTLFEGITTLLQNLNQHQIAWGIVTNKAARFTDLLIPLIGLQNAGCIISGDTTPNAKPHPEPLFEAARRLNFSAHECWYAGDDLRDIQAAKAANMRSIGVTWGYAGESEPYRWQADLVIDHPSEIFDHIVKN